MTRLEAHGRVTAKVRTAIDGTTDVGSLNLVETLASTDFAYQGVVRWSRDGDPEHRAFGVHNVNVRRDGGVELYWGAYDLSFDEALTVARRKLLALGGAR